MAFSFYTFHDQALIFHYENKTNIIYGNVCTYCNLLALNLENVSVTICSYLQGVVFTKETLLRQPKQCTYIRTYSLTYLLLTIYLLTYSFNYLLTYSLTYLVTYILTYLLTHLITYLLT
jgi:hypothetical protein